MKKRFRKIRLSKSNKEKLNMINSIVVDYQGQGLILTLRQLYYQLVSRDIIANDQKEYSKLSKLLKEGRMAGVVDWEAIEDRLRSVSKPSSFDSPSDVLKAAINSYERDRQEGQKNYVEVWVEKDALSNVLEQVTAPYHVPMMVNRGYSSVSAMYDSYNRFRNAIIENKNVVVFYLGDYDPSGLDMIRDIKARILEFLLNSPELVRLAGDRVESLETDEVYQLENLYYDDDDCKEDEGDDDINQFDIRKAYLKSIFDVIPIALTKEQIKKYNPPPNPAKMQDPRANEFVKNHGTKSWEVDALKPEVLNRIVTEAILSKVDVKQYEKMVGYEAAEKKQLNNLFQYLK